MNDIYAKNGWRYDRKVTAMMVEDMQFDPILAAKVLLNIRMTPPQELRVLTMWTTHMTMDDSGFSTGKSITHAIVAALRCMLFPHRTVGILSGTFRQGQLIFNYYDQWVNASKIFRNALKKHNGEPRLVHMQSLWFAKFTGDSEIRVLPPNILQDSLQLRSERWNDAHIDEWVTFNNYSVITKTIFGRATKVNPFASCPVRQNHIHLSSTPEYEHSPSHSLVKFMDTNVASSSNYARFTCNWRHMPRTKHWVSKGLVDYRTIHTMQTMNPPGVVKSEIDGLWASDSQSFYMSNEVDACRESSLMPYLERLAESGDVMLGSFDTARGANATKRGASDDFSFSAFRLPEGHTKPIHALTIRKNNINAASIAALIHKFHRKLHFSLMMYDPMGGGLFVADELQKTKHSIDGEEVECTPIIEAESPVNVIGDKILIPFQRRSSYIDKLWGSMASDSVLVNRMHTHFTEAIRNRGIALAPEYDWTKTNARGKDVGSMREYMNTHGHRMKESERIKAEMDIAVSQLILVDIARAADGSPMIDSHGMFKFKSKEKKDSAYSLCYCYVLYMIWKKIAESGKKKKKKSFAASIQNL